jgi:Uma2 family endonuclease
MASVADNVVPQIELIDSDGEPFESLWHFLAIGLLMDCVRYFLRPRTDYFVGGNMFLYYSEEQARNRDYRGPDFFFVDEVDGTKPRRWWTVWEEDGRYPNFILELLSKSTAQVDLTTKKQLYERTFRTHEYICYDPDTHEFKGWRMGKKGRYQAISPNDQGWLWCESLELWLGLWTGKYMDQADTFPRFYDAQGNLVQTHAEAEEKRAESEKQRAESEKQRADRLEAQLARLKAQGTGPDTFQS